MDRDQIITWRGGIGNGHFCGEHSTLCSDNIFSLNNQSLPPLRESNSIRLSKRGEADQGTTKPILISIQTNF